MALKSTTVAKLQDLKSQVEAAISQEVKIRSEATGGSRISPSPAPREIRHPRATQKEC
jgi:hypothetical protein